MFIGWNIEVILFLILSFTLAEGTVLLIRFWTDRKTQKHMQAFEEDWKFGGGECFCFLSGLLALQAAFLLNYKVLFLKSGYAESFKTANVLSKAELKDLQVIIITNWTWEVLAASQITVRHRL